MVRPMNSFRDYVDAAGTKPGIWRTLLGLLIIVACWFAVQLVIIGAWLGWRFLKLGDQQQALAGLEDLQAGGDPALILLVLSTFIGIWPGVFIAAKTLHNQRLATIFAPRLGGGLALFLKGMLLAVVFAGGSLIVSLSITTPVRSDLSLATWAMWLMPILAMVFVQAVGEELMFRAYLLQQLARIARSPIIWAVLPSVAFGFLHAANAPIDGGGIYYIAVTAISGITLAVLVWRSGSLWAAAGLHFGINAIAIVIVGSEGLLYGMQLFSAPKDDFLALIRIDAIASILLLAFVLSPLGRIFGDGTNHRTDARPQA